MSEFIFLWAHGDSSAALDLDPWRTLAGATLRFAQAVLEGAPYLLCGVVLSGLLRGVVGGEAIRRRLGTPSLAGVLLASASGFFLPLGALGALPVARRLFAMGAARGTALAFLLSAAIVDPLSIILGLSLMGPRPVVACIAAALAWSLACALLVNRFAPGRSEQGEGAPETVPVTATGRLLRVVSSMTDELSGPALRDMMLASAGAGFLGAFLPPGWLQGAASPPRATGGLVVAAVGAVASETPLEAMRLAGVLLRDGYTHQVAFTLLAFGSGFNLASLVWLRRGLGLRPGLLAGVMAIGLLSWSLLGWGFDRAGHATPDGQLFHTHAFDEIGRANVTGQGLRQVGADVWATVVKSVEPRLPALTPIALLAAVGLVARQPRIRATFSRWGRSLEATHSGSGTRAWERPLSPRWTAALSFVAAVPAVVVLVLAYYPAPPVLFDEMTPAYTDVQYAVRLGKVEEALMWIDRWEDLVRKLGPAAILRRGSLDAEARRRLDELIDDIGALRGFLEERRIEEARTLLGPAGEAQRACRQAFDAVNVAM